LNSDTRVPSAPNAAHRAFAAFTNRDFRIYVVGATAAMMADNIEHVISYKVMFDRFHSAFTGTFAVISHWVPYLLFAGITGGLADRFDIRRLIQLGMVMFMGVSVAWGVMFLTDTLTIERGMILLVIHGLAGVIWIPAAQVLIHQIVAPEELPSAVRLNATGRYLGFVVGPLLGAGLLLGLGPAYGIFVNALIYTPLFIWLIRAPYGAAAKERRPARAAVRGYADVFDTIRLVARSRVLLSMTVLVGAASFFIGNAYQAQMPGFASDLGHERADFTYGMLLGADAAGGLLGGLILETGGWLLPRARTAFVLAMIWCAALFGFARTASYGFALVLLFIAGFVELAFNSMAQALVQINAPNEIRGRVIGVFAMSANGLRTFSGLSVGLVGVYLGIHWSLALSAAVLFTLYGALFAARTLRPDRP
jgi:MFS family permease